MVTSRRRWPWPIHMAEGAVLGQRVQFFLSELPRVVNNSFFFFHFFILFYGKQRQENNLGLYS